MPIAEREASGSGPLAGVRVLDFSQRIAGPYCGKLLAQLGADVVKAEPPGRGDPSRTYGPFPNDIPHAEKSAQFLHLNLSKRGVTLDLSTVLGQRIALNLLEESHIVIESFKPGAMERLGLGPEMLRTRFPRLIVTSISNFGQGGPYRDWLSSEAITYAMGGPMQTTGLPEYEPVKLGATAIQHSAGLVAALATLTSWLGSLRSAHGDHLDVSLFETQAGTIDRRTPQLVAHQHTGASFTRRPAGSMVAAGARPCKDGYVIMAVPDPSFERFKDLVGGQRALDDPRFASTDDKMKPGRADEFDIDYLLPWLLERTMDEACSQAQALRVACTPVYSAKDLLTAPLFRERALWQAVTHPRAGTFEHPRAAFRFGDNPPLELTPSPTLGQHNRDIYTGELGMADVELARLRRLGVI
jgi:crotonobetainyl-CoA:carnitine CoA-transferase CaiB-like acyl-CoA transferase